MHDQKATLSSRGYSANKYRLWISWIVILFILNVVFWATIDIAPFLHMDEILIVELGRNILNTETNWSVAWLLSQNKPVITIFYLGPVLQEVSYQLIGELGPRISAFIGAGAAATLMLNWLISRGVGAIVATILALVFFLDPLFVQAFTMGRVDGWAMCFCIAACCVLRNIGSEYSFKLKTILAGALSAAAVFVWPSALFLYPLIFLELLFVTGKISSERFNSTVPVLRFFSIGCLVTAAIIILPIMNELYENLNTIIKGLLVNTRPGTSYEQAENPFIILLRSLKFTPLLTLFALIGILIKRDLKLAIAVGVVITLMVLTVVYIHRVLYLVPYFIAAVSALYYGKKNSSEKLFRAHKAITYCLGVLLIWAFTLSVLARPALAFSQYTETERVLLHKTANEIVGKGNYAVLTPFELYYAGNELGWSMYRPYIAVGEKLSADILKKLLPNVDYVILINQEITEEVVKLLDDQGFRDKGWYHVYKDPVLKKEYGKTEADLKYWGNLWRLRTVFSIYRQPYGPYRTYVRQTINRNI
ncbi:hypothetical protein [Pontibacter burrus]|uniref:Glycosyltransferase RgtA/B/C/D-like domain-containing protein n=1 Tax=Pontibacter burrus TaxID=2704466 RepID=A0A6B3LRQ7_9BACT|nr:hypothetical protein [Pontibacter burrus]NEM97735.1 hypothetical protein [Pontibacter burrus]